MGWDPITDVDYRPCKSGKNCLVKGPLASPHLSPVGVKHNLPRETYTIGLDAARESIAVASKSPLARKAMDYADVH